MTKVLTLLLNFEDGTIAPTITPEALVEALAESEHTAAFVSGDSFLGESVCGSAEEPK